MDMYVQGVSTRRVKIITGQLCGHEFSASAVSAINKSLDEELERFMMKMLPEAWWQRCYVHFLRNALDHLPRKRMDECLSGLRWVYDCHEIKTSRRVLAEWLERWRARHPKLCEWVEENIEETLTFYRLGELGEKQADHMAPRAEAAALGVAAVIAGQLRDEPSGDEL